MADEAKKCECAADVTIAGVKKMAEVFEKTSKEAWDMLVKQQIFDGLFDLLLCIAFLCAGIWGLKKVIRWMRSEKFDWDDGDCAVPAVIGGIVAILCIIISSSVGIGSIKQFLNPQYYAAIELIEDIK